MTPLILASSSVTRRHMLEAAGLAVQFEAPDVNEMPIKTAARRAGLTAGEAAARLAEAKALAVSGPDGLIIGADQILECDGIWHDKPANLDAARQQLLALRGRSHRLWTAVVVARTGIAVWRHIAAAELTMRMFSDDFLDGYLSRVGTNALSSVGAYQLEGLGIQLFEKIEGDFFTILGLPLLPLLGYLRQSDAVAA